MMQYSPPDQIKACRALALERNRQMFEEAQGLSRCAFEMLDGGNLDVELFDRYQALRRKADLKFQEAIEHLHCSTRIFRRFHCPSAPHIICATSLNIEREREKSSPVIAGLLFDYKMTMFQSCSHCTANCMRQLPDSCSLHERS